MIFQPINHVSCTFIVVDKMTWYCNLCWPCFLFIQGFRISGSSSAS